MVEARPPIVAPTAASLEPALEEWSSWTLRCTDRSLSICPGVLPFYSAASPASVELSNCPRLLESFGTTDGELV